MTGAVAAWVAPPAKRRIFSAQSSIVPRRSNQPSVLAAALLQLLQNMVQVEAAGLLARRKLGVALQVLGHDGHRREEHIGTIDAPLVVVAGLTWSDLEGIGAQVDELRETQRHKRILPYFQANGALLHEQHFPAVIAQGGEVAVVRPVEKFLALTRSGAGQKVALVVAIQVNLEGLARSLIAGQ